MPSSNEQRSPAIAAQAASAIERAVDQATQELTVLRTSLSARDAEIERLQEVCDDRSRVIADLRKHADTYRLAAEERAGLVASLDFTLQRLQSELERTKAGRNEAVDAAKHAAEALERQRHEFAVVFAEVAARDAARERLQEVCDERDRLIQELSERCTGYRRAAEERAGMAAALQEDVQHARRELERIAHERDRTLAAAETSALAFEEERQRVRLLCGQHDAALQDALRAGESLRERVAVLEDGLSARAGTIGELQAACDERLALIGRLSAEVELLRNVAEERLLLLESNLALIRSAEPAAAAGSGADDAVDWRAVADERKRALDAVHAEAERRAVLLADVTAALEGRTRENEELRGRLTRTS
jgi:chromosome segregation ATPase